MTRAALARSGDVTYMRRATNATFKPIHKGKPVQTMAIVMMRLPQYILRLLCIVLDESVKTV
ncbi:hypothetical protein UP10_03595 [Bradyrhizobium sp. LTSPM299]|nr:hypothetical protein UP10_03595 [Bradyrhizobium sp. LTSPM299]